MSQAQIGNLQVMLGINTAQFAAGLASAQGSLEGFSSSLKKFAAAAGISLSLGAVVATLKSGVDHMDELGKAAQKIGIPTSELSKLEYAAKLADVSLDDLTATLAKFSKNIAELQAGGQNDTGQGLKALGISALDAQGKLRPTIEIFGEIADKFANMQEGAGKTALAIALFGKSGAELIPLLNGGRDAIRQAGDELQRFGGVVTPEAAAAAETFNDNLTRLQTAFQGLTQEAVIPLLQPLTNVTEAILNFANTGPQVASGIGTIGDSLKWLTEKALNAYTAIWSIGELASTALTDPLNTDAWEASLERIRMQAEATQKAIEDLNSRKISATASDVKSLLDSIPGATPDSKVPAPIIPQLSKPASSPVPKIPKGTIDDIYGAGEAFQTLWDDMAAGIPTTDALSDSLQNMADVIADSLANAIVGLISGTMSLKEAFRSMAMSIAQQLQQLAAQIIKSQIFRLISMLASSATGGMGFSFGGMSFGGFYADGGSLGSGKWGIAGENGPEIVHGPANITPISGGSGSSAINVSVNNYAGAEVRTRRGQDGALQIDIIKKEIANDLARGGNVLSQSIERGFGLKRSGR